MRARILFFCEILIVIALVLVTRCANYRDVFSGGQVYFVDADCYARMTRARICFEHPGTIIRHHDFENFPIGTSPHTTAPFDYLIVALAAFLRLFNVSAGPALAAASASPTLDLAGAIVSPLIAVATGIFLCWWTRRMQMRFRFALLALFAVSPILAHGTALGRPDHQSLLIGLITVALCGEWALMDLKGRASRDRAVARSFGLQKSIRGWNVVGGISWALAIWVSLYEPSIFFVAVLVMRFVTKRKGAPRAKEKFVSAASKAWVVFIAVCAVALIIERRLPVWPARETSWALQNWAGTVGELSRVAINSRAWFEWCGWLLLLAPLLFWPKRRDRRAPSFLIALLLVTFVLTMMQARWGYFFVLIFALLVPEILSVMRKPLIAASVFLIGVYPIAQAWDSTLSDSASAIRAENRLEQMELRVIASEIDGAILAPWWFSPALAYWSGQPAVGGSSHESITGIADCALFYATIEPGSAAGICRRRKVKWVVSYDSERIAENSGRVLHRAVPDGALCYVLDRHPSAAPPFLKLVRQTARFKLYRVEGL